MPRSVRDTSAPSRRTDENTHVVLLHGAFLRVSCDKFRNNHRKLFFFCEKNAPRSTQTRKKEQYRADRICGPGVTLNQYSITLAMNAGITAKIKRTSSVKDENSGSSNVPSGFILKLYQMVNGAPNEVITVRLFFFERTNENLFTVVEFFDIETCQRSIKQR